MITASLPTSSTAVRACKEREQIKSDDGDIFFGEIDGVLFLRLVGIVRYTNCESLDGFVDALFDQYTFTKLVIDLRKAESIDSTNLGILVKIAQHAQGKQLPKPLLVCDSPDLKAVIASMGINEVYKLSTADDIGCKCKVFTKVESLADNNTLNLQRVMLDAHEKLSEMNTTNQDAFREVLGALKGEL